MVFPNITIIFIVFMIVLIVAVLFLNTGADVCLVFLPVFIVLGALFWEDCQAHESPCALVPKKAGYIPLGVLKTMCDLQHAELVCSALLALVVTGSNPCCSIASGTLLFFIFRHLVQT